MLMCLGGNANEITGNIEFLSLVFHEGLKVHFQVELYEFVLIV